MKKRVCFIFMISIIFLIAGFSTIYAQSQSEPPLLDQPSYDQFQEIELRAKVEEAFINPDRDGEYGPGTRVQEVTLTITSRELEGEILFIDNVHMGNPAYDLVVEPGDRVLVGIQGSLEEMEEVYIKEFIRDRYLYMIVGAFLLLLLIIGRLKGLKTIITIALTILLIIYLLIPGILRGYSPILLAIIISVVVTFITLFIIAGVNVKSVSAIIGILGGVFIAGLITLWIGAQMHLTGFSSEESMMLLFIPQDVELNVRGLLFAGIIIGSMGAVMDVGISIASSMQEVLLANPRISNAALRKAGFNVGRDIMGTMANTLILAYVGSAIPLLILFSAYEASFGEIVNLDVIATEVVRALAGSIGLILTVPITVYAGVVLMGKSRKKTQRTPQDHEA